MSAKSYDPACYELAEHFLKDEPISEHSTPYEQACHDLALTIQQAVEDWFVTPEPSLMRPVSSTEREPLVFSGERDPFNSIVDWAKEQAETDTSTERPMFECPDCGGDIADKGHLPTCPTLTRSDGEGGAS